MISVEENQHWDPRKTAPFPKEKKLIKFIPVKPFSQNRTKWNQRL
jgi:hypothetical protein